MSVVIDQDSECGFVYGSLIEFIKCWENGASSRLVLETIGGNAWVNLSCCLGRPYENHVVPARRKPTRRQNEKNTRRAAEHKQKIQTKGDADVIANKDDEVSDTMYVWVNVITNDKVDTIGEKKLAECVGQCAVKEINEDYTKKNHTITSTFSLIWQQYWQFHGDFTQ